MSTVNPRERSPWTGAGSPREEAKEVENGEVPTAAEIQDWLVTYLAELLEIEPDNVGVDCPFSRFGLDSVGVVAMTGDMQDWLGCELHPTLAYDYPTIDALASHLAEEGQAQGLDLVL